MRRVALVGFVSLALSPVDAEACTQIVGIFGVAPEGVALPANGRLLVAVAPSTSYPLTAHRGTATGSVPLDVVAVSQNHFAVDLAGVSVGAEIELEMPGFGPMHTFTIGEVIGDDRIPPSAPSDLTFTVEYFPYNRCFGPLLSVQGALTPGTDDVGVVAHELSRVFPDGHEEVIGIEFFDQPHQQNGAFNLYYDVTAEPDADERYCFAARAIDRAGQRSDAFVAGDCADAPVPDAGFFDSGVDRDGGIIVPDAGTRDAGTRDAGTASVPDAGPAHDSGFGGGPLDEADSGCGCTAAEGTRASWMSWLFAALIFARRRRVSSACR